MTTSDIDIAVDRIREAAEPTEREDRFARCGRELEFRCGPNSHTFHACDRHRRLLEVGAVDLFFAVERKPLFQVAAEDEIECDFCREG